MDTNTKYHRVILDLVTVLNDNNLESRLVWNIITALRGPDNRNYGAKDVTTARIRAAIGIASSYHSSSTVNGATINHAPIDATLLSGFGGFKNLRLTDLANAYNQKARHSKQDVLAHFAGHVFDALEALVKMGFIDKDGQFLLASK